MADTPQHVAIIMDGNGRWARSRGMPRSAGHRASVKVVRRVVEACIRRDVRYLTLFAFSSENWRRPPDEVGMLMKLMLEALAREVSDLHKNRVRMKFIGDRSVLGSRDRPHHGAGGSAHAGQPGAGAVRRFRLWRPLGHHPGVPFARRRSRRRHAASRRRSTRRTSPRGSRSPACRTRICSSGPAGSCASAISCCGISRMRSCTSPTSCFRTSARRELDAALRLFARRERRFGKTSAQVGVKADA